MFTVDELIQGMLEKLKTLPEGSEITTSDLIYLVCDFKGDPMEREVDLSLDDLFMIDESIRRYAVRSGIYLDSARFDEQNMCLPFDRPYVIRKLYEDKKKESEE